MSWSKFLLEICVVHVPKSQMAYLIKDKSSNDEFSLKYISSSMLPTGELSLIEAEKEIEHYCERSQQMFKEARTYAINSYNDPTNTNLAQRLEHYEDASDMTEIAIADYLHNLVASPTSLDVKKSVRYYLYLTTEVESVCDRCFNISRTASHKVEEGIDFTEEQTNDLNNMFDLVEKQLEVLSKSVSRKSMEGENQRNIFHIEKEINELRFTLKVKNIDRVNKGTHSYNAGIIFMDMIEECESLGDAITKIAKEVRFN